LLLPPSSLPLAPARLTFACRYTTGSAYREIDVYIDGCLAAAFYPAIVVYTGGICPLLWRPLTSFFALDIPANRLDISPFVGALNDGKPHEFSFRVVHADPAGSSGVWYVLLLLPPLPLRLRLTFSSPTGTSTRCCCCRSSRLRPPR